MQCQFGKVNNKIIKEERIEQRRKGLVLLAFTFSGHTQPLRIKQPKTFACNFFGPAIQRQSGISQLNK
jgi:hypothetical protein